jgi:hypothetical protein
VSGARKFDWRGAVDWSARAIVRLWPRDTKDRGRAFAAKLLESEGFSASMQWLIEGALLLMREHFRSFWKSLGRPIGVSARLRWIPLERKWNAVELGDFRGHRGW